MRLSLPSKRTQQEEELGSGGIPTWTFWNPVEYLRASLLLFQLVNRRMVCCKGSAVSDGKAFCCRYLQPNISWTAFNGSILMGNPSAAEMRDIDGEADLAGFVL